MDKLKTIFKKQGGWRLIKQYCKSGTLFVAISQFVLLGKSRTSLEILRLSTQLKNKMKFEKKYKAKLQKFKENMDNDSLCEMGDKIWVCWLQGIENAPEIVKVCYQSLQENIKGKEIILVTEKNYRDYVMFPEYIQKKIDAGIISGAHMTDLLRLELLIKYGGTWIDATVLCTSGSIPEYMLNSDLFMFQCLKPGKNGHSTTVSNWFITAVSNNKILIQTRYLLYLYWNDYNEVIDYFVFHELFQLVIESNQEEWNKVIPFDNAVPHIILLRLFEKVDIPLWNAVLEQTPFHKLSYKFDKKLVSVDGTYYEKITKLYSGKE